MPMQVREAALKAVIVLVPSYLAAYLTDKMVWVVPTLAAAGFFAGSLSLDQTATRRRLDDDGGEGEDDGDGASDVGIYEQTGYDTTTEGAGIAAGDQ